MWESLLRSKFLLPIQMIQSSCFMFPFAFKIIQKLYCCYLRKKMHKKKGRKGRRREGKRKMHGWCISRDKKLNKSAGLKLCVDSRGQRWQGRWELNSREASGTLSQAQCLKPALVWGSLTPARRPCLVREDTSAV